MNSLICLIRCRSTVRGFGSSVLFLAIILLAPIVDPRVFVPGGWLAAFS